MKRTFQPRIIETKEQFLRAMRNNELQCSKYNLLNQDQKLFVELVVFGEYTPQQAMKSIKPKIRDAKAAANRMFGNELVAQTIEELSMAKNKSFTARLQTAQDVALDTLLYIIKTTDDPALKAGCAKTILDKGEKIMLAQAAKQKDDTINNITFKIEVDPMQVSKASREHEDFQGEANVINIDDDKGIEVEVDDKEMQDVKQKQAPDNSGFVLTYEGLNNYE